MNLLIIVGLVFLALALLGLSLRGFVFGDEVSQAAVVKRRLRDLNPPRPVAAAAQRTLIRDGSLSTIPQLHRVLTKFSGTGDLQNLLRQAGNPVNVGALVLLCAVLAAIGLVIGLFQHSRAMMILLPLVLGLAPIFFMKQRAKRRLAHFEEQFPEAVELMARALRAGHSFSSAMSMVGQELEDPVAGEFAKTFEDYSYGKTVSDALDDLSARVGLQDLKFFVTAVKLQRETGGNLAEIMDNIGYIIRERFRLIRQVKALSAEGRLSGTILTLLAPALLLMLWTSSPSYVSVLFNEPRGQMMLMIGVVFQVLGVVVIKRLTALKL